ncbi:hypothetical protein [Nocardioides sp. SYSU DS0663]|uniref:hypothetical protein n=1 Tax=Nocardioides sp. SYSU DS0663 TaxID=3416445 RepID=UPI003F4C4BC1
MGQAPGAGARVPIGSRVEVEVNLGAMGECGLDLPPAPAQLDRVARLFVRFARGHGTPPVDTPVRLHLGGHHVRTLATEAAGDRSAWRTCPEQGSYAGHSCPLAAVDVLAGHPGPLAVTSRPPEHPCAHPAPLPGAATIQADEQMTCVDYFAVRLLVNDVGQVTAVDLVLAEP